MPLFCSDYSLPGTVSPWQPHSQGSFITSPFLKRTYWEGSGIYVLSSQMEKGREQQTLGKEQRIFLFLFLNLPPSWMDMGQKEMIKNCLVRWILSSISEHPDMIWIN